MDEGRRLAALQEIMEALGLADRIAAARQENVTYETMQRSGFRHQGTRAYTLQDARRHGRQLAAALRRALEQIDPSS